MHRNFFVCLAFLVVGFSSIYAHKESHPRNIAKQFKSNSHTNQERNHDHNGSKYRENTNETLALPIPGNSDLKIVFNTSAQTIGFFTQSTQSYSVLFNYSSGQLILFNGPKGSAIAIDLLNQTIGDTTSSWNQSTENFESFCKNSISSIGSLVNDAARMNLTNPSEKIVQEIANITSALGISSSNSSSQSLQRLLKIARILLSRCSFLTQILNSLGNRELRLPQLNGIDIFARTIEGIARLFALDPQLFTSAIKSGFDLSAVLNSSNGLEAFEKFIQQIAKQCPTGQSFAPILNNLPSFLGVLGQFSGRNNSNDNALNFLSGLVNVIESKSNPSAMSDLIKNLIRSNQSAGFSSFDLTPYANQLLQFIQNEQNNLNNGSSQNLDGCVGILKGLLSNNLVHQGANLSNILDLLRKGDFVGVLENLTRIFIQLNALYNPFVAIPLFIAKIIFSNGGGQGKKLNDLLDQIENGNFTNIPNAIQNLAGGLNLNQIPVLGNLEAMLNGKGGSSNWQEAIKGITDPLSALHIPFGPLMGHGPVVATSTQGPCNDDTDGSTIPTSSPSNLQDLAGDLFNMKKLNRHKLSQKNVHHVKGDMKNHHNN